MNENRQMLSCKQYSSAITEPLRKRKGCTEMLETALRIALHYSVGLAPRGFSRTVDVRVSNRQSVRDDVLNVKTEHRIWVYLTFAAGNFETLAKIPSFPWRKLSEQNYAEHSNGSVFHRIWQICNTLLQTMDIHQHSTCTAKNGSVRKTFRV